MLFRRFFAKLLPVQASNASMKGASLSRNKNDEVKISEPESPAILTTGSQEQNQVQQTVVDKKLDSISSENNEALIAPEFATQGIAFSVLEDLMGELGSDATFHDLKKVIMNKTRNAMKSRSLASFLSEDKKTKHLVGKADYFVSYAWSGSVRATLNAIGAFFKSISAESTSVFVWIDVAMVDQYAAETTNVNFDDWAKTFQESLVSIGKALIVMTPGTKPIAISRSWCCFEWVCIKQTGISFNYAISPYDEDTLINDMKSGMGYAGFNKLFAAINVEQATAFKKSDQVAILELMRHVGVKQVNDVIMLSLKDWLLRVANEGQKRFGTGTTDAAYLLNAKASLYEALGDLGQAKCHYEEALEIARKLEDENPFLVATLLNNLADILRIMGDVNGAEPLFRESLSIRKRVCGDDDHIIAQSLGNLALLLQEKGQLSEAEVLYKEALPIKRKLLGNDHPEIATSLNNLGLLLQDMGDNAGAEQLYREALEIRKRILGETHPSVATSMNNLAMLLQDMGRYDDAEALHRDALRVRKQTLGDDHPDVAQTLNNLAGLMFYKGNKAESRTLFEQSLRIRQNALGEHPTVAMTLLWLATLEKGDGDHDLARKHAQECFEMYSKLCGSENGNTKAAKELLDSLPSSQPEMKDSSN